MASKNIAKSKQNNQALWLYWAVAAAAVLLLMLVGMLCWHRWKFVATCQAQQLQLMAGQQSGAAGTIYQHMVVKNTGKTKCGIGGFPTAFLYGADGYALGAAAAARPTPQPTAITLDPGESAFTVLGYPQAGNFPPGVCSANKSTILKLYTPSGLTALETPLEVAWCPGFSASAMVAGS